MKIAIIGAGNMGGAVAKGIARGSIVASRDIRVSNPSEGKLKVLRKEFPEIQTFSSNREAAADADVIIIAVKPWKFEEVAEELRDIVEERKPVVASMVGGSCLQAIEDAVCPKDCIRFEQEALGNLNADEGMPPLYHIIPNTAVAVGEGMTYLCSRYSDEATDHFMTGLFAEMGDAQLLEERFMGAGMALASCGIAYALRYVSASIKGGIELGMFPADAKRGIIQTLKGAAALLEQSDAHPETEIEKVTTPAGITIRGINAMEAAGFSAAVVAALRASH